ncbi:glycosyltransferase [Kutzneria sp. CA-103260]|uniref:glycosyltransferase n=1 Tax=Kutzneria sp. CA-103260 TaxID=2802641 RepID=UPI001BA5E086|nr:glycosyltransferase [Kutzneria sp. CA-103260]QUQ70811.1 glycosyltransferase [Kutzneria sp. CA-103260]
MARIVILTVGTRGDVAPLIGLGAALQAAGHQVRVTVTERLAGLAADAGLDFHRLDTDPTDLQGTERARAAQRPGARGTASLFRLAAQEMGRQVPAMRAAARDADIVLCTFGTVPMAIPIAEANAVPCLVVPLQIADPTREFGPAFLGGRDLGPWLNRAVPKLAGRLGYRLFAGFTRELRAELGLPPEAAPGYRPGTLPLLYGVSPTVVRQPADWPDNIRVAGYWWLPRPSGWRPAADLERFLAAGPPPVYLGFGSVDVGKAEAIGRTVREAIDRTGLRVVVQRGWMGLDVNGDNVFTIDDVPHDWLFERVAAAVHHAGAGTTAAALRAGIPSVPVPFLYDQRFWARRLVDLGTAPDAIPAERLSAHRLAAAITSAATESRFARAATAIAGRIAEEDGVAPVLAAIDRLVPA